MAGSRNTPCNERLEQRAAHDVFDIPTTKRQRAQVIGGECTSGRPGAQRPRHRRRAHSAQRRPGCRRRPGAQRPCHRRERVARGGDGSRAAPAAPPGAQVRSALGAERRAPSAERRARGGDQARRRRPGAQRPRHRRRARSARRRWLRASGCPTPHTTAGRLLPASATIKKKWVTSPGPGPLLTAIQRNLRCCLPAIYLLLTLIHAHLRAIYPHFTRNSPARYPPFTRTLRAIHLHFPAIHLQFTAVYLHL